MVTITDFKERTREDGSSFFALELQGGIDLVMSQTTGQYYVTAKRAYISSTFNETMCASLIGTSIPGTIVKQECDSYEYVVKETGELITLSHRWVYRPEEAQSITADSNEKLISKAEVFMKNPILENEFAN